MTGAPYPPDTRAKGWRLEIDHERVRQSDTWALAAPDARPWLLMMWMVAWEQTPCGALPNDDALIVAKIGIPAKVFAKHRSVLMRCWWLADDNRLYHDVLVQRVGEMLKKRMSDAQRAADARARRSNQPPTPPELTPESRVTHEEVTGEFDTKHQAPVPVIPPLPPKGRTVHEFPPGFAEFWAAYPRKVAKDAAAKAFAKRKVSAGLLAVILKAVSEQSAWDSWKRDGGQYIPHPATWLNDGRWQDERESSARADDVFAGAR
jgi:hypothetical protein